MQLSSGCKLVKRENLFGHQLMFQLPGLDPPLNLQEEEKPLGSGHVPGFELNLQDFANADNFWIGFKNMQGSKDQDTSF